MQRILAGELAPLTAVDPARFERPDVSRAVTAAARGLAEFKGTVGTIPNQRILLTSLGMQEAKDSSAIENIVTTDDELFREAAAPSGGASPAAKEVLRYREALQAGAALIADDGLLTVNRILRIQQVLELNDAGLRKLPGTVLKDGSGRVVYTPPQDAEEIVRLMRELETFINATDTFALDPLVRMALIHHQFESIHPFYDGNGRTGRIINVLYLMKAGLLDAPVLYLSRSIVRTKSEYYRLLQAVREHDAWEDWVVYLLHCVADSAAEGLATVRAIHGALLEVKHRIRADLRRIYSQDLVNNLFVHPYTKVQLVADDLDVSRVTATKYLEALTGAGILRKISAGRHTFYINTRLVDILAPGGVA